MLAKARWWAVTQTDEQPLECWWLGVDLLFFSKPKDDD